MNIIIIGPQASGKGTQAAFIAQKLGIVHVSTGKVFRQEVRSGSERGKLLKQYLDRGVLVPSKLNDEIVLEVLNKHPTGIVLDGYPRNKHQTEFLDAHAKIDKVFVLQVPDAVCIERISGRRVCDNGHDYHVKYKPPKQDGVCDEDELPLHMRDDDKPDAVKQRLEIYHTQTEPILKHYEDKLIRIDGTPSIKEVSKAIEKKL